MYIYVATAHTCIIIIVHGFLYSSGITSATTGTASTPDTILVEA